MRGGLPQLHPSPGWSFIQATEPEMSFRRILVTLKGAETGAF